MPEKEKESPKVLTLDDKKYEIDSLSDEVKNDIRGLQVCDSQLRIYQDTLRLLTISRQTITGQLKDKLKDIKPLD